MASLVTVTDITIHAQADEPRILDIDLAERLGFQRARAIRQIIERNDEELRSFGNLPRSVANPGKPGRPSHAYWLNEEQALLVATLSSAPKAAAVRSMLIRCFTAWRRGELLGPRPRVACWRSRLASSRKLCVRPPTLAFSRKRSPGYRLQQDQA